MTSLAPHEILIVFLVSVAEQDSLSLILSETPKTGFIMPRPIWASTDKTCLRRFANN